MDYQTVPPEQSIRYMTAAIAIRETEAAYYVLGRALASLERYDEAENAFRAAIRLQPDYAHAYFALAEVLHALERPVEALAGVEQSLTLLSDFPEAERLRDQLLAEHAAQHVGEP